MAKNQNKNGEKLPSWKDIPPPPPLPNQVSKGAANKTYPAVEKCTDFVYVSRKGQKPFRMPRVAFNQMGGDKDGLKEVYITPPEIDNTLKELIGNS